MTHLESQGIPVRTSVPDSNVSGASPLLEYKKYTKSMQQPLTRACRWKRKRREGRGWCRRLRHTLHVNALVSRWIQPEAGGCGCDNQWTCVHVWASSIGTGKVQTGESYLGCHIHVNTSAWSSRPTFRPQHHCRTINTHCAAPGNHQAINAFGHGSVLLVVFGVSLWLASTFNAIKTSLLVLHCHFHGYDCLVVSLCDKCEASLNWHCLTTTLSRWPIAQHIQHSLRPSSMQSTPTTLFCSACSLSLLFLLLLYVMYMHLLF
jgi:hypothetical protein